MSKRTTIVVLMLTLLLAFTASSQPFVKAEIWDIDYVIQTTVTYSNKGTTVWNLTEEDQTIGLFMNNTWQTVYLTECSYPVEKEKDEDGNPTVLLQVPDSRLEPGENATFTVTYNVDSKPRSIPSIDQNRSGDLTEIPENLTEVYCKAGDAWLTGDTTLQQTAQTIAGNETKVLSIVEGFIAWIWKNIHYGSSEIPRYPNETFSDRKGDCDDQAILLITFCRILGIPSYLQTGCIYDYGHTMRQSIWEGHVTSVLRHIAWHGWAMVYVPPWGWLPVDLTYIYGGRGNPLNAIRTGAVTSQGTIQYMNVSQRDYVASSRRYRDFLIENGLYIYQTDEMSTTFRQFLENAIRMAIEWVRWVLIGVGVITGAVAAVFIYIWNAERQRSDGATRRRTTSKR